MSSVERTLVLSTSYPATEHDPSGHFVRSHALELARAGAEVHVLVPGPRGRADEGGLHVVRLGSEALFGWPGAAARAVSRPLRLAWAAPLTARLHLALRALGRVDRIVAHWMVPTAFPLLAANEAAHRSLARAPLELVSHGADARLLRALPSALRHAIVSRLIDRADLVTFVAESTHATLESALDGAIAARLARKSRVRPCPIAVPPRDTLPSPSPHSTGYAVWVGRDVASKRLDLAVAAAREARAKLVVVGAERPVGRGLGHVTFVGPTSRDEALAWIAHADVLLSTSATEAAPTAAREARALGVPVVACPSGDLARWAESDPGIAIVEPDPRALGAALRALA